ncbi:MAG: hypothetical protein EB127_13425 [Alphaproteobacteria bacterium]|nr:hypothetical protein [Alphaproteobacteria bacterium]
MWIINWLPEFIVHLIFLAGVVGTIAGFVLGFIPFVSKYKLPIQIISLLLLSLGVYLEGGLSEKAKWELRVKEMEAKVAAAQAESQKTNVQIVEKIVTEKEYIKVKGQKVVEYIDREVKVFDANCTVPEVAIKAHDMSAGNEAPDEPKQEGVSK